MGKLKQLLMKKTLKRIKKKLKNYQIRHGNLPHEIDFNLWEHHCVISALKNKQDLSIYINNKKHKFPPFRKKSLFSK